MHEGWSAAGCDCTVSQGALQTYGKLTVRPGAMQALAQTKGYSRVEARRRMKHDKQIAAGVLMPRAGMDEGVDRRVAAR